MLTLKLLIVVSGLFDSTAYADSRACNNVVLRDRVAESVQTAVRQSFKTDFKPPRPYAGFFTELLSVINERERQLRRILSRYNNKLGSDIELKQVRAFLQKAESMELPALREIEVVENSVIYASTNVPLYSLIAQGALLATFSQNVWLRTPTMTRQVYLELYEEIQRHLAHPGLVNLHLVTDNSDVSYDQFNRIFVMGMNRQGTRSLRKPSELVIFTGNPESGRVLINRNLEKLNEIGKNFPGYKQLFLGFMAGINPAVVTASARENMEETVNKIVFPLLVNSGQDCMNSDVIFVHKNAYTQFKNEVLRQFNGLDFTPLTFSPNLDPVIQYREKYKANLVNKDAAIDSEQKLVGPHLFRFQMKDLPALELREHFAPVLTVVTYENRQEIENALLDPRFQARAMYGLVFGSRAVSPEMEAIRDKFREYGHQVLLNSTLFDEYEMNHPFGGTGTDTSMIVSTTVSASGRVMTQWGHHPISISREVQRMFPRSQPKPVAPEENPLAEILKLAERPESVNRHDRIENPNLFKGPIPLTAIREAAQSGGLSVFVNAPKPASLEEREDYNKLFGVPVVFSDDRKKVKGVLIQAKSLTENFSDFNSHRGELNPMLGYGQLYPIIATSKSFDYHLLKAVEPELMPSTTPLKEFYGAFQFGGRLKERANAVHYAIAAMVSKPADDTAELLENQVIDLVKELFASMQILKRGGVYFKNYGEFASGDLGNSVTGFQTSPLQIAKEFSARMYREIRNGRKPDAVLKTMLSAKTYENYARFVAKLLTEPDEILVQSWYPIQKTDMGQNMEVRLSLIGGNIAGVRMRYGFEYYPREMQEATNVLRRFLAKCPPEIQSLSGGVDMAKGTDGRWYILEFNFGMEDGTLEPAYYPYETNLILSYLRGEDTYFISYLKKLSNQSINEQRQAILDLHNEKPVWQRESLDDISRVELAKILRDMILAGWASSNDKAATADETLDRIKALLEGLGSAENKDFEKLYLGAALFVERERTSL